MKKGFSLTEVMLAVSMITITMVTLTMITVQNAKSTKQADTKAWLERVGTEIEVLILDDAAWANSIGANNNSLGCLLGGNCNAIVQAPNAEGYYPFEILQRNDGTVYFDSRAGQNQGFNRLGVLCGNYDANGNDACPFHVNFDWRPLDCPANGTCDPTRINVRGNFVYSPGDENMPINVVRYSVNVIRDDDNAGAGGGNPNAGGGNPNAGGGNAGGNGGGNPRGN